MGRQFTSWRWALTRYLLILAAALLFASFNSGWLLGEGYWGIDEGIFHRSILKAREAGAAGGFAAELAAAYDPGLRNYGPNYVMFGWACTRLFGTDAPWAMDYKTPLNYYHSAEMIAMLDTAGFEAKQHSMTDILPYPHMLYVCRKKKRGEAGA